MAAFGISVGVLAASVGTHPSSRQNPGQPRMKAGWRMSGRAESLPGRRPGHQCRVRRTSGGQPGTRSPAVWAKVRNDRHGPGRTRRSRAAAFIRGVARRLRGQADSSVASSPDIVLTFGPSRSRLCVFRHAPELAPKFEPDCLHAGSEEQVTRRWADTAEQGGVTLYSRDGAFRQARSPVCGRRPRHSCSSSPHVSAV